MISIACSCAALALSSTPPAAVDDLSAADKRAEIALGLLDHGVREPFSGPPPPGFDIFEGEEERGSRDIQFVFRSKPLRVALKPRLTARLQLNTVGDTSFASVGAEWRQHALKGRVYAQIGIGLALHDGFLITPDPREPGLSPQEVLRRFDLEATRTSLGSRVLFNPNLSIGLRITPRVAVEAAYEHFSHAAIFGDQNPGLDNLGIRFVVGLGN